MQPLADGDGFNLGDSIVARFIGDQEAVLSGRKAKGSSPISSQITAHALWIAA